jgi:glycosyltransferase involved in cell wall biosynthesis
LNQAIFSGRSKTKLLTIPSAIFLPPSVAREGKSLRTGVQKRLLFVGRLSPEKQVDKIIEAWASIKGCLPDWKLRIIGSGPLEETWKRLASDLQASNSIEWHAWTSDIWHEYQTADAFVISSRYEGFPQSLVEAISVGLPGVILDCSPAIRQCVTHEESALIVPTLDDLPKEMLRLLSDETLRQRLGKNAKLASQRFQWDVVAPDWEEAIRASLEHL